MRFHVRLCLIGLCLLGAGLAAGIACGPPPDGWQGAGRSYNPPAPAQGTTTGDAAANDTSLATHDAGGEVTAPPPEAGSD
jgi:hypothetical protein